MPTTPAPLRRAKLDAQKYLPFSVWLGFVPLPLPLLAMIVGIMGLYVVAAEITKRKFYAHPGNRA
jgi:uncharacterized BrkB/YihY/UPF0761 family membrane protein